MCKEFSPDPRIEVDKDVIQLKGNKIPKGLVTLERFFSQNDVFTCRKKIPNKDGKGECEKVNIGSEEDLKWITIGKCCTLEEKRKLIELVRECIDVFAWCYDDLKEFRNGHFRHQIPLKPGATPFR